MSLKAAGAGVPRRRVTLEAGTSFETTFVSGKHVNLMVAHRPPGYHSRPTPTTRSSSTTCRTARSGSSSPTAATT